jgi:hypothetical protein
MEPNSRDRLVFPNNEAVDQAADLSEVGGRWFEQDSNVSGDAIGLHGNKVVGHTTQENGGSNSFKQDLVPPRESHPAPSIALINSSAP